MSDVFDRITKVEFGLEVAEMDRNAVEAVLA